MGSLVGQTVRSAADLELTAEADVGDPRDPLRGCDVVVDFTSPAAVMENLAWCVRSGLNTVVGTSGFDGARLAEAADVVAGGTDTTGAAAASRPRVLVVPNFSVGAVLMMTFAAQAARFFESAEIVELHHAGKADAPSGTAARTASLVATARTQAGLGPPPDATTTALAGARGADVAGVHVHSIRLSGLVAHHEVLFGGHGEALTIRHDSLDRASFMPGVLTAIRGIRSLPPGLTVGLDALLGVD